MCRENPVAPIPISLDTLILLLASASKFCLILRLYSIFYIGLCCPFISMYHFVQYNLAQVPFTALGTLAIGKKCGQILLRA